ncbi:MAG: hypothetical protein ACE5PM_02020 [Candidatus Hydrothermarchaeales archaeon]
MEAAIKVANLIKSDRGRLCKNMMISEKIERMIEERRKEVEEADEMSNLLNRLINHISDWRDSEAYPIEKPIGGFKAPFDKDDLAYRQGYVLENADEKHLYVGIDGSQCSNEGYTKFATIIYGGIVLHSIGEEGIYESLEVANVPRVTKPWGIDCERFIMEATIARCIGIKLLGEELTDCLGCAFTDLCGIKSFDKDYSDLKPIIFMDYPLETSWLEGFRDGGDVQSRISAHKKLLKFSNDVGIPVIGIVSSSRSKDLYTRILDEINEEYTPGIALENMIQTTMDPITETLVKWVLEHRDRSEPLLKKGFAVEKLINSLFDYQDFYDDWKILRSFSPNIGDRTSAFRSTREETLEWYPYPIDFFFVNTYPDWARVSYTGCGDPKEAYHHFLIQSAGMQFFYPFILHRVHHEVAARPELRMLIEDRIAMLMGGEISGKLLSKRITM